MTSDGGALNVELGVSSRLTNMLLESSQTGLRCNSRGHGGDPAEVNPAGVNPV